ncbi:ribonuclease III [bacterium]|nr:ribonuclease III [bacterium]
MKFIRRKIMRKKPQPIIDYDDLEKRIGVKFTNRDLLKTALTHRSYINENREQNIENNERLEFLGDAVLELIISDHIYKKYPEKHEGELTSIRSALVRTESIAEESKKMGIGQYLLLSKGEEESGGKDKEYIIADLYEAVLGAIYLDKDYETAKEYVTRTILKKVDKVVEEELFIDPKTKIQELSQAKYKVTPTYTILKEEGPDHDKHFTIGLFLENKEIAQGVGTSKQKAEEDAARKAILIMKKDKINLK